MSNDDKKFFGLCIVVEDKVEDKFEIKVLPVSYVPDMKSEINKNTNGMLNLVDSNNFHTAIASTIYAFRATVHGTLKTTPGAIVFNRDMLLNIPLVANLRAIRDHRQQIIDKQLRRANVK